MRTPDCYSACYAIIENSKWEILFQKRANTGFRDGCFQMPAGHIEWEETMKECLIREMKEELNIDINNIRRKELFWYDVDVIKMIEKWEKFSEIKL